MLNKNGKRILILDSLRGVACSIVCFHHLFAFNKSFFNNHISETAYFILDQISNQNSVAVLFFFVLSGFSIGLSVKENTKMNGVELNQYLYRRLKRILPIYWLAIIVSLLIGYFSSQTYRPDFSLANLVGNLLFLQTAKLGKYWFSPYGLNAPLWSLSYEMFFYLFFPICYWLNNRYFSKKSILARFALLVLSSIVCIVINKYVFIPYLMYFSLFCIWILGYLNSRVFLNRSNYSILFGCVFIVSVVVQLFDKRIHSDSFLVLNRGLLIGCIFYFIQRPRNKFFTSIIQVGETVVNRLFNFIGKGSYALYALHYPVLTVAKDNDVSVLIQALIFISMAWLCVKLEEWTIKKNFSAFNLNYTGIIFNKAI
jgi:peptidoglycan/LPS O-acetylase OafA/YrhL